MGARCTQRRAQAVFNSLQILPAEFASPWKLYLTDGGVETGGGAKGWGWYKTTQLQPQNNPGFVKLNGGRSHGNEENFFQNLTAPSFLPTLGCLLLSGYSLPTDMKNIEL